MDAPSAPTEVRADEGLYAFETETSKSRGRIRPRQLTKDWSRPQSIRGQALMFIAMVVSGAALAFAGVWAYQTYGVESPAATLSLATSPAGAAVWVNDQASGTTPVALTLPAGVHRVRLATAGGQERSLEVTLKPGESVVQQIEWTAGPDSPVTTGALHVQTDPPKQAVFVDGVRRGVSPLIVSDLAAGEHQLLVTSESGSFRRRVAVTAGNTLSVVVAPRTPAVTAGWVRVTSPVLLQMRVRGDLIGNSESDRVMLPAGEHDIDLINDSLGFAARRQVTVRAGQTSELRLTMPNGVLNVNATPWAEVWLDGVPLGETPLGNVSAPIGLHRVMFRHPQLGERHATVTVSLKEPARLGVDMRQR